MVRMFHYDVSRLHGGVQWNIHLYSGINGTTQTRLQGK